MIVIGDIHGEWEQLAAQLRRACVTDQTLIQVGDFGLGFRGLGSEHAALMHLDELLVATGSELLAIRGNHDDPGYFDGHFSQAYRAIRFLPDYSVLDVEARKILFVGGALSVDRRLRQAGRTYWPDEGFHLDADRLARLDLDELWAVVTHTAPEGVAPLTIPPIVREFAARDRSLLDELAAERQAIRVLYDLVTERARPAWWFYGHFHQRATGMLGETAFRLLDIMEMLVMPPQPSARNAP